MVLNRKKDRIQYQPRLQELSRVRLGGCDDISVLYGSNLHMLWQSGTSIMGQTLDRKDDSLGCRD